MTRLAAAAALFAFGAGATTLSAPGPRPAAGAPASRLSPSARPASPAPLTASQNRWVERTLKGLTLEQKAAQLIGVRAFGLWRNRASREHRELLEQVKTLGVGHVVVFESEVAALPLLLNELQDAAAVPLLISADMERGMAFRIRRGVVPLPYAMAIGATRSEDAARFTGEIAAREARALGVHWAFAPVADVNNNPANPVINIRSYGEDPELVARMASAFVRGARAGGLLTTAKHFPGHGDTGVDSHLQLVTVDVDRARLDSVELLPFRAMVEAGADSVMLGHIAVPAVDPSGTPATLSEPVATGVLRRDLGFDGLIVTDAMEMSGVRAAWTGEAAVRAVQAGADVILLPPDADVALQAIARAVRKGQIAQARLDESVRRTLALKARLGLHRNRKVDPAGLSASVGRPEDVARAMEVARQSITVVKNEGGLLPLRAEEGLRLLHLVLSSDARNDLIQGFPEDELGARRIPTHTVALGPEVSPETTDRLLSLLPQFTHVVASAFVRVGANRGNADMSESHARLLRALVAAGRPVVMVSYGSPYLLRQVPEIPAYVCAYGAAESSQRAAVGAIFGEYRVQGRLPVSVPGLFAYGEGIELPQREMTLRRGAPREAGLREDALREVDRVLREAVSSKAFPGAVAAVGRAGTLAHLRAYGRFAYADGAPEVREDTVYDLASLTKVIVTTTMAMILVDEGRLDLDKPVSAFLPAFRGGAKDRVTVRQLLTHSSGIDWWAPLFKELKGQDAYVERIVAMDLAYEPGTKSLYSDLGLILLGEILERVAGRDLETFARERIFEPLGMKDTGFRPSGARLARVPPTEDDPWRGRVLKGEVHDENAFALGGVAPHAGLFGTAEDLARFAQMLLNGGVFEHRRIVSRATLEKFTARAGVPESSRALGWDTPSPSSSAGDHLSAAAFGHTGYTGTSMWIDPERQLFFILLSNRVHPTRDNNQIRDVRRAFADAVAGALEDR